MRDITRELTMWCSRCSTWHQESARQQAPFVKRMRKRGWRLRGGRWLCSECAATPPKDLEED